ncbi:MAG: hypothetical protein AAB270_05465 [Chloroflexota bacterium]
MPWAGRLRSLANLAPALVLMMLVLGTIYTGVATLTESAAIGALGSFAGHHHQTGSIPSHKPSPDHPWRKPLLTKSLTTKY